MILKQQISYKEIKELEAVIEYKGNKYRKTAMRRAKHQFLRAILHNLRLSFIYLDLDSKSLLIICYC
jgi:hypothetical protein